MPRFGVFYGSHVPHLACAERAVEVGFSAGRIGWLSQRSVCRAGRLSGRAFGVPGWGRHRWRIRPEPTQASFCAPTQWGDACERRLRRSPYFVFNHVEVTRRHSDCQTKSLRFLAILGGFGGIELLKHFINRSRFEQLKELKRVELEVLELRDLLHARTAG